MHFRSDSVACMQQDAASVCNKRTGSVGLVVLVHYIRKVVIGPLALTAARPWRVCLPVGARASTLHVSSSKG